MMMTMMKKHKTLLPLASLSILFALTAMSCNDIRYDTAPKNGIQLPMIGALGIETSKIRKAPDTVTAFLWPSEVYFEREQELGFLSDFEDYQTFIQKTSAAVTLASDEFDEWTLIGFKESKEIEKELKDLENAPIRKQIASLNENLRELRKQGESGKEEAKRVFREKRALEKGEELARIKERESALNDRLQRISAEQVERVARIQEALDPHAVTIQLDDAKNPILDSYDYPLRSLNEKAQINWIKTYQNTAAEKNIFEIDPQNIHIQLGEWNGSQVYKTHYLPQEEGGGLHPDSSIYDVSFSSDEVLKFKFRERDERENETGRIFEFILQRSLFDRHVRFVGDILVTIRDEVVRRGQMKVILVNDGEE
ncbi:MAG: hypothetical protein OXB88_07530 [Bacteriovoracales bacterium]|nr:hypothetical protein [Bacteriovoracales bacterium]